MENNSSNSIHTLDAFKEKNLLTSSLPCRIEFIKDLAKDQDFDLLINFNYNKLETFIKKNNPKFKKHKSDDNNDEKSVESFDTRVVLKKKVINFAEAIAKLGTGDTRQLEYIKSGTTGHTFKGIVKNNNGEFNYAVKVVAYPKKKKYGSVHDSRRPENAEIMIIKALSWFIINKETPHIVLPIGTFDTSITTFVGLIERDIVGKNNNKYKEFEKYYKKGYYYDNVSILISEWANRGDLLEFIKKYYKNFKAKDWKVFFFQIISTLAVIQDRLPNFRHNDLKANNVLVHKIGSNEGSSRYCVDKHIYIVPNIGYHIKIWDFDFACIPDLIDNIKVSSDTEWNKNINVLPIQNRYYDMHYFFNTLIKKGFFHQFLIDTSIPTEAIEFLDRILPEQFRNEGKYINKSGRILTNEEFIIPNDVIKNDPYFEEFRVKKTVVNKNINVLDLLDYKKAQNKDKIKDNKIKEKKIKKINKIEKLNIRTISDDIKKITFDN